MIVLIGGLIMIIPFIWIGFTSFKPPSEIVGAIPSFLPRTWTLENYTRLPHVFPLLLYLRNSVIVSAIATLFIAFGCPAAGYIFAKYQFRGKNFFFLLILSTILIPFESYVIYFYMIVNVLQWVNTFRGLIFPNIIMASGIFFLRQNIKSLPNDLIDAARIDGCSEFQIFLRIIYPLAFPATAAICIIHWVWTWSTFIWPLIITSSDDLFTMPIGLMYFERQYFTEYGGIMTACVISFLPILIIFLLFRSRIIEGVSFTGLKY